MFHNTPEYFCHSLFCKNPISAFSEKAVLWLKSAFGDISRLMSKYTKKYKFAILGGKKYCDFEKIPTSAG